MTPPKESILTRLETLAADLHQKLNDYPMRELAQAHIKVREALFWYEALEQRQIRELPSDPIL